MQKLKITLGVLLLSQSLSSYAAGQTELFGIWGLVTLQGDFKSLSPNFDKFQWKISNQNSVREDSSAGLRLNESLGFGQIGYQLNANASFWMAYLYDAAHPLNRLPYQESRLYQDFVWTQNIAEFSFTSRFRFEERIQQTTGDVGYRAKQFIQITHALPFIQDLSVYVNEEAFFHLNQTNFGKQGFSENRFGAGLSYQFTPKIGGDLGYLEQYIDNKSGNNLLVNNLQMNLRYKF